MIIPFYYHYITPHMSAPHSTRMHPPFKTMLGNIGVKYLAYYTTYKAHAIATYHRGTGCPLDRGINLNTEDPEFTDIDNESTFSSDATVALGGPAAEGHPEEPVYTNHNKLMVLMRKINDLHQCVKAEEGQQAESLDYMKCELQNLQIALHPPPPPTPTEPFREVMCKYRNTLCTTQKQTNLTNSLLQT